MLSNSARSGWRLLMQLAMLVAVAFCSADVRHARAQEGAALTGAQQEALRQEALNKLKTIGIALANYHDVHKRFPPPAMLSPQGNLLLSWRVAILPYLDQKDLYDEFDLTRPWDSEHNRPLVAKMPEVYRFPLSKAPAGSTVFMTVRGADTAYPGPMGVSYRQIRDGTSKTIAVVEGSDTLALPWTKPGDCPFNAKEPAQLLGGHFPGVILANFCDGSAHALPTTIGNDALRALLTRDGREAVGVDENGKWRVGR